MEYKEIIKEAAKFKKAKLNNEISQIDSFVKMKQLTQELINYFYNNNGLGNIIDELQKYIIKQDNKLILKPFLKSAEFDKVLQLLNNRNEIIH